MCESGMLLPCPFCGREAHFIKVKHVVGVWYTVCCDDAECFVHEQSRLYTSKRLAAEAWNRRAERTCHLIHEVEEEDDEFFDTVERHYYVCSECGSENRMDARYCDWCGARVIEEES